MAYDPVSKSLLLFGGFGPTVYDGGYNDTWQFLNGTGSNITSPSHPIQVGIPPTTNPYSMAYDSPWKTMILLAGGGTWSYSGTGNWTSVSLNYEGTPTPYQDSEGLFFFANGSGSNLVIANGVAGPCIQVWKYLGNAWQQGSGTTYPQNCEGFSVIGEEQAGVGVLFGGLRYTPGNFTTMNSTWTLQDGNFSLVNASGSEGLPGVEEASLAYDPTGMVSVLFGGLNVTFSSHAAADGLINIPNSQTWLLVAPLSPARIHESRPTLDVGQTVNFSVEASGGLQPYQYAFSGLPPGCESNGTAAVIPCAPTVPGRYSVSCEVTDALGRGVATSTETVTVSEEVNVTVAPPSPDPTTAGVPVQFRANVTGGLGPETIVWTFGNGEQSQGRVVTAVYATAGTYTGELWVNDSNGEHRNATETVSVNPTLAIVESSIPGLAEVGIPVSVAAVIAGGTPPYTVAWNSGESSAGGGSSLATNWTYREPGNVTASLRVTDAAGANASVNGTIEVVPRLVVSIFEATSPATEGLPVAFGDIQSGGEPPVNLSWAFGDGTTGWGPNPMHTYTYAGTFGVRMTARDSARMVVEANLSVTVGAGHTTLPPPPATSSGGGLSPIETLLIGGVLVGMGGAPRRRRVDPFPPPFPRIGEVRRTPANTDCEPIPSGTAADGSEEDVPGKPGPAGPLERERFVPALARRFRSSP